MTTQKLSVRCSTCDGTGIDRNQKDENGNVIPKTCIACNGDGWLDTGVIDTTEITDELGWIKKKIKKILQKLEISEE